LSDLRLDCEQQPVRQLVLRVEFLESGHLKHDACSICQGLALSPELLAGVCVGLYDGDLP
jgi:hypothetical protein